MLACTLMLLTALFCTSTDIEAQIKWQENFDYPTGDLYGQGGWGKYGSNPNEPIQVVEQTLDYSGYPGGVKGKSVKLGPASAGEDLLVRFDPSEEGIKSGTIYYSALINVSEVPTGPTFVMTLLARTANTVITDGKTGTELGKLYVDNGEDENHYKLGVERGSTKAVYSDKNFNLGETYLIVVKYEIGAAGERQDGVTLYVNPTSYTEDPLRLTPCLTLRHQVLALARGDYRALNCVRAQAIAQQHQRCWLVLYVLLTAILNCLQKIQALAKTHRQ